MPPKAVMDEMGRVARAGSIVLTRAEKLLREGKLGQSEKACGEVNRIWGAEGNYMSPGVAHVLGQIRMRQGRYADAVRIMAASPERNDLGKLDLALCYAKTGRFDQAAALYDPHLITGYNSAFPHAERYLPDTRPTGALEGALLWCKGVALSNVGRADEATDSYAAALKHFPKNPLLAARLGLAAENAGRPEVAASALAIVQRAGDDPMREVTRPSFERANSLLRQAKP